MRTPKNETRRRILRERALRRLFESTIRAVRYSGDGTDNPRLARIGISESVKWAGIAARYGATDKQIRRACRDAEFCGVEASRASTHDQQMEVFVLTSRFRALIAPMVTRIACGRNSKRAWDAMHTWDRDGVAL